MYDFDKSTPQTASVLAVSGGGLLGVIPAAMLMRYEALGLQNYGPAYRLSDSFNAAAGSSTGAVIAAGVALGLRAQDIADFYLKVVPVGFRRKRRAIPLIHDMFDGDLIESFFERRTAGRLLTRQDLHCDLTILTKDLSRGVSVAFTTTDGAGPQVLGAEIRCEAQPLSRVLRASTAAPGLFPPVEMTLAGTGAALLADGGVSLFNDPSYLAARLAQASGAPKVDLTVLGTGSARPVRTAGKARRGPSVLRAMRALFGLIKDGESLTDCLLADLVAASGGDVTCRRHDMRLIPATYGALGLTVTAQEMRHMRGFADVRGKARLFEAALMLAEQTIHAPLPLAGDKGRAQAIDTPAGLSANCAIGERLFHD